MLFHLMFGESADINEKILGGKSFFSLRRKSNMYK